MDLVSAHPQLRLLRDLHLRQLHDAPRRKVFTTGLAAIDGLLPDPGGFARGAVHEVLADPAAEGLPRFFALLLARAAARAMEGGYVAWCDARGDLYPPAVAAAGLSLDRLLIVRPQTAADEVWAAAECMGCRGVAATVAAPPRLSRVEVRRLQLAAERGGGAGILLRRAGPASAAHYAAATRWLVRPAAGSETVQRWSVQLVHGHGGLVNQTVLLEVCRDAFHTLRATHPVRALEPVADRPAAATA
jgi:hypothetical protein